MLVTFNCNCFTIPVGLHEKSSYNIPHFVQLQCQVTMMYLGGYCHVKFIAIVAKSLVIAIVSISLIKSEYISEKPCGQYLDLIMMSH
jgi:hypothetical protein